jgi:putative transposase
MARPLRIEFSRALYHVTSRGNARQDIFLDDQDREAFLDCFSRACQRHHWQCHAYCLMGNHYHLLIETGDATLSKGMKYLNGTYTQLFNRRYQRVGHVFQGRFKAILVEKDAYLQELARYIVLNPVRARMVRSAKDWAWSSYRATAGMKTAPECLSVDWLLGVFGKRRGAAQLAYREFVAAGAGMPSPWESLKNQIYLGSDEFLEDMQCRLDPDQSLEDVPQRQKRAPPKPLDYFSRRFKDRDRAMAEAYRSGQYTLAEIGSKFGVSYATVSRAAKAHGV